MAEVVAVQPIQRASSAAYVMLTKPRVISLLLVTTIGAMLIASPEWPSLIVIAATLVGGALAAGGANAINQYIDRDIDVAMVRTGRRPIPAGQIQPLRALTFGVSLMGISFVVLSVFANLLSATLALGALLFYVFVYTKWLKRSTPSNIVIGGAAGAVPPLVGWAAVAGDVSLLAIWLFVIVFYWTPPHFWALSLLIKTEYARARVPMLPNVVGDDETRRQIVLYSVLMVALTASLYPFRMMGLFYFVSSLGLGLVFVLYALRLRREATNAAARRLFRYSMYYLTLLFVAMVVDFRVFGGLG